MLSLSKHIVDDTIRQAQGIIEEVHSNKFVLYNKVKYNCNALNTD